jgi:DNA (cytosine-5)-methyltransferase 1
MKHLDLFSGIGGFAYAIDQVFPNVEHIFCDNDKFCQAVLKKHWPKSKIYGDIRTITADTKHDGIATTEGVETDSKTQPKGEAGEKLSIAESTGVGELRAEKIGWDTADIITGGFPCQPFSQAGKRRGTEDNRYLWPEMFRVIQSFKPTFVIAENVRGLVTWNEGMVLEQVCADLEGEGYEVQPLIIPAVAVNAPHRRDRVWIIACHPDRIGRFRRETEINSTEGREQTLDYLEGRHSDDTNTEGRGCQESRWKSESKRCEQISGDQSGWDKNWIEVATELCGVDDGLPAELDGLKLSKTGHRVQRLKSLGNAIVPQVALEIFKNLL